MDTCLVDPILEQGGKGNFVNGQLSSTKHSKVMNIVRDAFGQSIRNERIKNKLKQPKDYFGKCFNLFNAWNGISWDSVT